MTSQGGAESKAVELSIDGTVVAVASGTTLREACAAAGIETPTLCWAENLTPVNACRLCVLEVEGSRALVPACSALVTEGAVVLTDSERVRHSRRMVLEFLGATVDLSQAPELSEFMDRYDADPERHRDNSRVPVEVKIEDDLFIRDYDKCVLCYKCVQACGDDAQFTFAISMSGRGSEARIATEYEVPLPESACVYCGNCVGVCPTNALQFKTEFDLREAGAWRPEDQDVTTTVCSYCGVGCNLELHTQEGSIVKVTSPVDHSITSGHLCIKGRFGWQYVQPPEPR